MSVFLSFIVGLAFTALFFLLSALTVIGGRSIITSIKNRFFEKPRQDLPKEKTASPPQEQKRVRRVAHSIEINPDEIDQIVVKKIS